MLKARSHGAIFLFATAMQKMDCVDANEGVHMVRFHVPAIHWCVRHRAQDWVPHPFCAIAMHDSNVSTLEITSKPIAPCLNKITKSQATFHFLI